MFLYPKKGSSKPGFDNEQPVLGATPYSEHRRQAPDRCQHQWDDPEPKGERVIKIGWNRERAASTAASWIGLPWTIRPSRAISTIRMPFFADKAIIRISPIWV